MKKIFIPIILLFGLIGFNTAFAQTTGTSSDAVGSTTPAVTFDYRYNAVLDFFLQKTAEKDYQTAYDQMHGTFQKVYPLENFKNIINQTGLNSFTAKKWISADDKMADVGVATIVGEFTMPDNTIHQLTFPIILQGSDIKIGNIVETMAIADLVKRFPPKETLLSLIKKDINAVTPLIKKSKSKGIYKYLSAASKKRTKFQDVRKAIAKFVRKRLDLKFPNDAVITIDEGAPVLSKEGVMLVSGNYKNDKNTVYFLLGYDYENWDWKLGLFTFAPKASK